MLEMLQQYNSVSLWLQASVLWDSTENVMPPWLKGLSWLSKNVTFYEGWYVHGTQLENASYAINAWLSNTFIIFLAIYFNFHPVTKEDSIDDWKYCSVSMITDWNERETFYSQFINRLYWKDSNFYSSQIQFCTFQYWASQFLGDIYNGRAVIYVSKGNKWRERSWVQK